MTYTKRETPYATDEILNSVFDPDANQLKTNATGGGGGGTTGVTPVTRTVTIADTATESDAIDKLGFSLGVIHIPSVFTGTTITFTVSSTSGGTYTALDDQAGNLVTISGIAVSTSIPLPYELAGVRFFRIVASAQSGSRTILVDLS